MSIVKKLLGVALGRRLPRHEGRYRVTGAHAPIVIQRDRWGIPSIDAHDDHDAWFGLGFCHAQDRGGQLEVIARVVRGTLAEAVGVDALPIDRLSRRLGIRRAGEAQLAVADADIRAQLEAYAAGINAGFAACGKAHEHTLLGIRPVTWEAADSQALAAFVCFALAANWDVELARLEVLQKHGLDALLALDPLPLGTWVTSAPSTTPDVAPMITRLREDLTALAEVVGMGGGSNAWAVDATKSETGRPILAGDPHLPPQAPSPFYFARVESPSFIGVGGTFVGIPAIAAGHNGHVAWGITAAHIDNTDWFIEEVGADGRSVRRGERFEPCEVRREVIGVKGKKAIVEDVLVTSHGPIVWDEPRLAMAATWLRGRPYRGLMGAHLCRTVADIRTCFAQGSTTNLGLVFATADHIGYLVSGDVPERKHGTGPLPQPGWDERFGWDTLIPNDRLPFMLDPDEGFIAAANNMPASTDVYLGVDFLDGYRVTAIAEALRSNGKWSLDAMHKLQLDTRSLPWEAMRAAVLDAIDGAPKEILGAWDGRMEAGSGAAALFAHLVVELCRRVIAAKAPGAIDTLMGKGATAFLPHNLLFARRTSHLVELVTTQPDGWFPSWPAVIREGVEAAYSTLRNAYGPDAHDWAWGRIRPLWLKHPFGEKAILRALFDLGPYPIGGDATTIPQASIDLRAPTANPIGIAVFRMVIDVGDWDASRFALCGGQSGNPFSPHAEDQVGAWLAGEGVPIHWSRAARARVVHKTLVLDH